MSSTGSTRSTAPAVVRRGLVPLVWASLVANVVIVVTGGAVRLTASGLGCPTWPRCTDASFRPHGSLGIHGAIEFGNRLLTFVLTAVVVTTFVAVVRARPRRGDLVRLTGLVVLGIPAQAVLGGVTVLTGLNPWTVAGHFLLSMLIIGVSPTPPLRSTTGRGDSSLRKNSPAGGATFSMCPTSAWSCSQVDAMPCGSRFTEMR